jgi:glycosyltransferase involved in cell wall biosynthesis
MQSYKKRVLIILYYWPPEGGVGVRRWLKFTYHLIELGWDITIFTADKKNFINYDISLLKEIHPKLKVIKKNIFEPHSFYSLISKNTKPTANKNPSIKSFFSHISNWIRANFFIPDSRMFWIFPSISFLKNYVKKNEFDLIISSSTPHSTHLIGYYISIYLNKPWIADFRDPWTQYYFLQNLPNTKLTLFLHNYLEKKVLKKASLVITVSDFLKFDFLKRGAKNAESILNGYDEEDYDIDIPELSKKFTLIHTGSLEIERNPEILWKVISSISNENDLFKSDLNIKLIGKVDSQVLNQISNLGFIENVSITNHIPHNQVIPELFKSHIMLLPIPPNLGSDKGIMPGKMYEYLRVGGNILAIGPPDGDAAKIILNNNAGKLFDFNDFNGIRSFILENYALFKTGQFKRRLLTKSIKDLSRKAIAIKLSTLMTEKILK